MKTVLLAIAVTAVCVSARAETLKIDESPIVLITPYRWASLNQPQRELYVAGVLETWSFVLYSGWRHDDQRRASDFSAFVSCARTEALQKWRPLGWTMEGRTNQTAARQFLTISTPAVCERYRGTGDGSWKPLLLTTRQKWSTLALQEKAIYVQAYVETVSEVAALTKNDKQVRGLRNCIAGKGFEAVLSELEKLDIEWEYPLPWSVSRANGKVCEEFFK